MKISDELAYILKIALMAGGIGFVLLHIAFGYGMPMSRKLVGAIVFALIISSPMYVFLTIEPGKTFFNVMQWAMVGAGARLAIEYALRFA